MYSTIHAVALRTVKHNDRSSILTVWSAELGRLALLMPAGNGPASRRRRALTMPAALFEGVVDLRPGRELSTVRDVAPWSPSGRPLDLTANPVAATVAMFVAEVIEVITREGGSPDAALWALITETVEAIAVGRVAGGLAAAFLIRLVEVSGIGPDLSDYTPGDWFDTLDGVFRRTPPVHDYRLDPEAARVALIVARASAGYAHPGLPRLDRATRGRLLDGLIDYFALHHYPLNRLKSLPVLRSFYGVG